MGKGMIVPFPSEWHGRFLQAAAKGLDVPWAVACVAGKEDIQRALSGVNNDACYSALVEAAQALRCGEPLRCGALAVGALGVCPNCRSCDKPYIIKRACEAVAGIAVDVVDDARSLFEEAGIDERGQRRLAKSLMVADALLQVRCSLRPYASADDAVFMQALIDSWTERAMELLSEREELDVEELLSSLDLEARQLLRRRHDPKPKVGLVGGVPALFNQTINGGIVYRIEEEGCEAVLPYLCALLAYSLQAEGVECAFADELERLCALADGRYPAIPRCVTVGEMRERGTSIVPSSLDYGGGWAQVGWMRSLLEGGIGNIVHVGTFGCLSGHVTGQGVLREVRRRYGDVNLASIEYDPGTSEVNQLNRIKLMASVARRNMERP